MTLSIALFFLSAVLVLTTLFYGLRYRDASARAESLYQKWTDEEAKANEARNSSRALKVTLGETRALFDDAEQKAAHFEGLRTASEEKCASLEAEVKKLTDDYAISQTTVRAIEYELEKKNIAEDERKDALNMLQGEKTRLQDKVQELAEHNELLKRQVSKSTAEYERVQDELIALRATAAKSVPVADWIIGTTNLAKELGVTGKTARHLMKTQGFPAPFHNVGANKLWDRKQINVWKEWQEQE